MKNAFVCVFLLALTTASYAQSSDMRFKRLTVDDGLSNNNVLDLAQDERGFIWIGTSDGLNRYDGYAFTAFRHNPADSTSLSNNEITALLVDEQGTLWVGTNGGLNRYEPDTEAFERLGVEAVGTDRTRWLRGITALYEDGAGRLWVGTTGGLFRFDRTEEAFVSYAFEATNVSDVLRDDHKQSYISAIYEDRSGRLWVGTAAGLNALSPGRRTFSPFEPKAGEGPWIHGEVRDLVEDARGNLWVATIREGLYRIDSTAAYARYVHRPDQPASIPSNSVRDIYLEAEQIVVATSEGLGILDPETGRFKQYSHVDGDPYSLSFPAVRCILEDQAGNLWIGTWEGLNYYDRNSNSFRHVWRNAVSRWGLSDNVVSSFAEDPDGRIWVGTERGGLNAYDPATNGVRVFRHASNDPASVSADNIKALHMDEHGDLWIGTHGGGLNRLKRGSERFERFTYDPADTTSISGDRVYAIYEDRSHNLWIGTNKNGLNRFDRATGQFTRYQSDGDPESLSDNSITAILEDRLGNLWIGTARGLNLFDPQSQRFTRYLPEPGDPKSLIDPTIRTLFEDRNGNLWIGTSSGLELFDRRREAFTHYTVDDGLPNNAINCIREDRRANLWVSTNQGLAKFDPATDAFRTFDAKDGLQSSQFNMNACLATDNGELYFGGIYGFNRFYPEDISVNPHVPPVYISAFRLFNAPVEVDAQDSPLTTVISRTEAITLDHDQNALSFDFVALNYTAPSKNAYAFMMEGFEETWNYVGSQRTATYTNLPPGTYTFRVKASNNDGVWNEQGASLAITIEPPLWKTWWAVLCYIGLGIGLLVLAQRHVLRIMRLKNNLAMEQVRRESEDRLHRMKMEFFTDISHEFRTPLTLILGPVNRMLDAEVPSPGIRDNLALIRRNAQRLLRLINQLMDLRKLEAGHMQLDAGRENLVAFAREVAASFEEYARSRKIRFALRADREGIPAWFDRDKLETVLVNILSNAFKFTPEGGSVSVEIKLAATTVAGDGQSEPGRALITIRDTGQGMSPEEQEHIFERFYHMEKGTGDHGTGIGLALSKGIVSLHQGTISVESEEGAGTTFVVSLPLGRSHLGETETGQQETGRLEVVPSSPVEVRYDGGVHDAEPDEAAANATPAEGQEGSAPLVLVVDDDDDMRAFIRDLLADRYRVCEARNGVEGLRAAVDAFPDLIICDVMMPEMDGLTLCQKLKTDLRISHIPVILLTARTSVANQVTGFQTGADDYVTKPFNRQLLLARVGNLIEMRRQLRERFSLDLPLKPAGDDGRTGPDDLFLRQTIEIIEARIDDPDLTVESLAQEVGMSRVYLHKKLTAVTEYTPSELIRRIRLKHGARLLLEGELNVSQVAYAVGFSTPSYFSTCFKKQYGQCPTDYVESFQARPGFEEEAIP